MKILAGASTRRRNFKVPGSAPGSKTPVIMLMLICFVNKLKAHAFY